MSSTSGPLTPSFTDISPLELMALAHVERVQSALLGWCLGSASPLPLRSRHQVIEALVGRALEPATDTSVDLEHKHLDLIVTLHRPTANGYTVFELKFNAEESDEQLARYDPVVESLSHAANKVFLTPAGLIPASGVGWRPASFETLMGALQAESKHVQSRREMFADYLKVVERLVCSVQLVRTQPVVASFVFGEERSSGVPGLDAYIARFKLQRLLQRTWLSEVLARTLAIAPLPTIWRTKIVNGQRSVSALLNFEIRDAVPGLVLGLQVQHRTLKMFCQPAAYDGSGIQEASAFLAVMRQVGRVQGRLNPPQGKGFTSISMAAAPNGRNPAEWAPVVAQSLSTVVSTVNIAIQ